MQRRESNVAFPGDQDTPNLEDAAQDNETANNIPLLEANILYKVKSRRNVDLKIKKLITKQIPLVKVAPEHLGLRKPYGKYRTKCKGISRTFQTNR
ncbi:hypothetical protein ACH5RR_025878 [Cinchona calisaya]|uniref:Uncharacterized protein n=1 Tax=Cinchona calisaya TaxID=153742 RepID=A0ABD2Z2U8_9GENT